MQISRLDATEYGKIFHEPYHVYNSAAFNQFNANSRNIQIDYLAFKTKKYKLGLVGGTDQNNVFQSPFSAPFGGFSFAQKDVSLETIDDSIDILLSYLKQIGITALNLTLPPLFYDFSFISKLGNSLYRKGFSQSDNDLNYSIPLHGNDESYMARLHYNARKNLNIAIKEPFRFELCDTPEKQESAYLIIKANREARGFPVRMSYELILNTIKIVKADFFLLKLTDENVAAALVFHVAKDIVQVVYWGDLPQYSANKTMNFLSYKITDYYRKEGIRIIDIGPSTENSIPNYGLCEFKESIGCEIYPKTAWSFTF